MLLAPSCDRILKLLYFLYILLLIRPAAENLSFVFLKAALQFTCGFSFDHRSWPFFCVYSLSIKTCSPCSPEKHTQGASLRVGGGLRWQLEHRCCHEGLLRVILVWGFSSDSWMGFLLEVRTQEGPHPSDKWVFLSASLRNPFLLLVLGVPPPYLVLWERNEFL